MAQKIGDRRTLVKLLRENGFRLVSSGKHEKWSDGTRSVYVPHSHSQGKWSRILAEKIVKEAGLILVRG